MPRVLALWKYWSVMAYTPNRTSFDDKSHYTPICVVDGNWLGVVLSCRLKYAYLFDKTTPICPAYALNNRPRIASISKLQHLRLTNCSQSLTMKRVYMPSNISSTRLKTTKSNVYYNYMLCSVYCFIARAYEQIYQSSFKCLFSHICSPRWV